MSSPQGRALVCLLPVLLATLLAACALGQGGGGQPRGAPLPTRERAANATLTYVAIGDSTSFGVGTARPEEQSWPSVLAGHLGSPAHLVNLGIPGATAAQALRDELPIAVDAQPDVVTVWLGINDLKDGVPRETFAAQLRDLLTTLRTHGSPYVFVGNIPDLSALPYFASQDAVALRARVARWNAAIAEAVTATGSVLVDIHAAWRQLDQHPDYIANDGLHPSALGAQRLAETFLAAVRSSAPGVPITASAARAGEGT